MSAKIDHLGIAVPTLAEGLKLYRDLLGFEETFQEEVPSEGVSVCGLRSGDTTIELLEPLSDEGPIATHLQKRGPGLHHIAVEVKELDSLLPELKKQGIRLLDETARSGSRGTRVAFIHPRGALGVLIELVEHP